MTLALPKYPGRVMDVLIAPGTAPSLSFSHYDAAPIERSRNSLLSAQEASWTANVVVPFRGELLIESNALQPEWLEPVLDSFAELLSLPSGWDSYGAPQISLGSATEAIRLLLVLASEADIEQPTLVPTSKGGIQLEWRRPGLLVELEVSPGARPVVLVDDEQRGSLHEETLRRSLEPVLSALSRF